MSELVERLRELADFSRAADGWHHRGVHPNNAMRAFDQAADHIEALTAENARLRERLELTGEFADGPDGIECRDDTIKLLDERTARLTSKVKELEEAQDRDRWRPIETLPECAYDDDECPMFFDLWGPIIGRFPNAYWSTENKCWVSMAADGSECLSALHPITHWMEKPRPPAALNSSPTEQERASG